MIHLPKSLRVASAFSLVCATTTGAYSHNAGAGNRCESVHARVHTAFTTTNCASPVGLCTAGKVTGGGRLDGATTFMAFAVAPSAGLPAFEPAANLSYSAAFTLTTRDGTLQSRNLGVLDASNLLFTEMARPLSGTGEFANWSGELFLSGSIVANGTAFDGAVTGSLCISDD